MARGRRCEATSSRNASHGNRAKPTKRTVQGEAAESRNGFAVPADGHLRLLLSLVGREEGGREGGRGGGSEGGREGITGPCQEPNYLAV